jgi:hypothetical protein
LDEARPFVVDEVLDPMTAKFVAGNRRSPGGKLTLSGLVGFVCL